MKKKWNKVLAATIAMTMVFAMGTSMVFATEDTETTAATTGEYGIDMALYTKESSTEWSFGEMAASEWSEPLTEPVHIDKDGTYTLKLTDLKIPQENLCLLYLKDVLAYPADSTVTTSNVPEDLMVITDVLKINDQQLTVRDNVRTGLKEGIFDVCYVNQWDENDCCIDVPLNVESIEITFTVTGITGEPGAIKYEAPTTEAVTTTPAETTSEASAEEEDSFPLPLVVGAVTAVVVLGAAFAIVVRTHKKKS